MKKQAINRMYNFPDADLYLQTLERVRYAERDMAQVAAYGFSKERLEALKAKCKAFNDLPSDDEMVGDQMEMTTAKGQAADELKVVIRSIMTRVAMKYPKRSGRYRKFGTAKIGDMSDAQLLFCGRRVARVAQQLMPFLEEAGLSQIHIDKVKAACDTFEEAVNRKHDKVSDRDIMVETRTQMGNAIYEELVVLSNIGKDIWIDQDPVRYEQYVLYESNNDQKKARKAREAKES